MQLICIFSVVIGVPVCLLAETPQPNKTPQLKVSAFELDALTLTPPTAKVIAGEATAQGWCSAQPVESKRTWNELPSGIERSQWVSVVTVGFNEQADCYALMFDGPDGAMSLAAHVAFRKTWMPSGVMAWIWPTDELLGSLQVEYETSDRNAGREPLALRVEPWQDGPTEAAKPNEKSNLAEARVLSPQVVLDATTVMVHAAAYEAGWAPRAASATWSATCQVRVEDQTCSFRVTLTGPQAKHVFVKDHVSWEAYHDYLVRIFRFVRESSGVSDFTQLARGNCELLDVRDDRLACVLNQELAVFDLTTGKKLWTTEPATKPRGYAPSERFSILRNATGEAKLLHFPNELSEFAWETGKRTVLASGGADRPFRVSAASSGDIASISGGTLQLHRAGKQIWQHQQHEAITAGPLVIDQQVICGDGAGKLTASSIVDGQQLWQCDLPARLYGPIVAAGELAIVFSAAAEAVIAVDLATGKATWQCPLSDVLLQTPLSIGKYLLLATKSNELLLIDSDTGKVAQKTQWPTWLVAVTPLKSKSPSAIACSDLAGTVTVLSLPDLKPVHEVHLGTTLVGPLLDVDSIAYRWPTAESVAKADDLLSEIKDAPTRRGPALLVTDADGFLYILPHSTILLHSNSE